MAKTRKTTTFMDTLEPLLKSMESNLIDAAELNKRNISFLDNVVVDVDPEISYAEKVRKWAQTLAEVKSAINEISDVVENIKSEWHELEDKCEKQTQSSAVVTRMNDLQEIYKKPALLSSLRKIITGLRNKIILIDQLQSAERELFNQISSSAGTANRGIPSSERNIVPESNTTQQVARVAPLKVPEFNGENYTEFIASFDDLIHNNRTFSENSKAQYFKSAIIGRAARCISGIPATGNNYQIMYDKIKAKYSRASSNKHSILKKLENLKGAGSDSRSLEDKVAEIEEILNQLNAANIGIEDSTNPVWQRLILRVFPTEISRKIITENHSNEEFTVRDLLDKIENEAFAISFNEDAGFVDVNSVNSNSKIEGNKTYQNNSIQATRTGSCMLCDSNSHSSANCNLPIGEKIKAVKNRRLCWKCFKSNHSSFNCTEGNCRDCNEPHHLSICRRGNLSNTWKGNNRNMNSQQNATQQPVVRQPYQGYSNPPTHQNTANNFVANSSENRQNQPFWDPSRNRGNGDPRIHSAVVEEGNSGDQIKESSLQIGHTAVESGGNLPALKKVQPATLMTCEARIRDELKNTYVKAVLFFDSGSQQTLINETFAQKIGLKGESTVASVSGVNGVTETFRSTNLKLELLDKLGNEVNIDAITKPFISKGFRSANLEILDVEYIKDHKLKIANSKVKGELLRPDILIGADNFTKLVCNNPALVLPSKLQVVETIFGACIFGMKQYDKLETDERTMREITVSTAVIECDEELCPSQMLKEMYEIESLGIKHAGSPSIEKTAAYFQSYKNSISFDNKIVTAPLPLKDDISKLRSNWKMANARLTSLVNSFSKNEEIKTWYVKKMNEYKEDGIIEEIKDPSECVNNIGTYYIPHHGVWTPTKIEKPLRIVFDASACQKGSLSLNDVVKTGEVFINKIANVVVAARRSKYIITCDIEAAFTQCRLPSEQRDLCRFLWLADPNKPANRDNIRSFRFNRVPFGVNASPSVLNMVIVAFLEKQNNEMAREILRSLYVDNVQLFTDDKNEIWKKITDSRELFKAISFNMREYVTNVSDINDKIPEKDRGKFGETKMLGVHYNTETDMIKAKIAVKIEQNCTRRTIVKQLHGIFDPIGFLAPSVVALRFVMREVITSTKHWNDQPSYELEQEWRSLIEKYNNSEVKIPRYIGPEHKISNKQILWVFSDASIQAFAASAYVQDSVTWKVSNLLMGKTKMTPKIKIPLEDTIPKYELTSILLGIEVAKTVTDALELSNCKLHLVNDSTAALSWVTLSKKLRRSCDLIRQKIITAVETLKGDQKIETKFFHCATDLNVADIGTRGVNPHELQQSEWVQGPKWLSKPSKELPITEYEMKRCEPDMVEDNEKKIQVNHLTTNELEPIFDLKHMKTAFKTRWIIAKVINSMRNKLLLVRLKLGKENEMGPLWSKLSGKRIPTRIDLTVAENIIIMNEQRNLVAQQLQSKYRQKEVFEDSFGIKRFRSRLQNAEVDYDAKNPIFIPNTSDYLKLVIKDMHEENGHVGKEYLKMLLRQRFWVPKPTKPINSVLKECLPCRISNSLPFKAPNMPQLPIDRVKRSLPFECTGVDCMGPFQTNEYEKVYVCLFTCLVVRAVHLEVISDISGSEFLKAFIRFTARRGIPRMMRSDNGTNFVLGAKVINSVFERDENGNNTIGYSQERGIEWIFNPPSAPFMGGVWERLVASVKTAFYKTVGRKTLSWSELQTLIVKIEAIVNSRPLTGVDNNDLINPLRPCDFVCPGVNLIMPNFNNNLKDPNYEPESLSNIDDAKSKLITIDKLLEKFWYRFKTEYLTALRDQQRKVLRQGKCSHLAAPRLHEIVLIEDDSLPKYKWNIGKIIKLIKSQDGEIRSAVVNCKGVQIHRPIIKLYSTEILSSEERLEADNQEGDLEFNDEDHEIENNRDKESHSKERQTRKTKLEALRRNKELADAALNDPDTEQF